MPDSEMPVRIKRTAIDKVAIGEQHGKSPRCFDTRGVNPHDIRAVRMPGDMPEALWFTLGTEHIPRKIKPLKGCVFIGVDGRDSFNHRSSGNGDSNFTRSGIKIFRVKRFTVNADGV